MFQKIIKKYNSLTPQIKATFWFFICSVLQRGISTITTPIFTRLLTTAEYGQYSVFNSWLTIVQIIVTLDLARGMYVMGLVKFKQNERVFSSSLQGLNLTLCILWTIIYLLFHDFWNRLLTLTTVQMLAMLVMIWAAAAFSFWSAAERNQFRYKALVIVTLIVSILKPVIGVFFVTHAEDKVTARILGLALVEVVSYTAFFIIQMKRGKVFYSAEYWKYAVLFNLPLIPHYLAGSILSSSDRIMIQRLVGTSAAGIYSLAYSISLIMKMVNDSMSKTLNPWLYQQIAAKEFDKIARVIYLALIFIAAANLGLIAIAPEVLKIFAPPQYYDALYIIPPVAMSVYVQYLYLCFGPFEFYYEKRIWTTVSTFTSAAVNILLNFLLIPVFGYHAAGYTTLVCYSMNSILHYYFMRKVCKTYLDDVKPYDPKVLLAISLAFMILGFMYIPLYKNIYLRYGFTLIILGLIVINRNKFKPLLSEITKKRAGKAER